MAIYDLTITLRPDIPTWDGEPGPSMRPLQEIGKDGGTARVSVLTMGLHCGTHVDAPCHFIPGALGVEALPLDALIGACRVVEVRSVSTIEPADLTAASGAERVLLKTPSVHFWDDPSFRRDFVALGPAAAERLVAAGVRLVGIDYLSVDSYDADPPAAHLTLLRAGVVVLEGLDLRAVPPGDYDLTCLPLKLAGADGAPARVVLRTPDHPHPTLG